MVVNHALKKQAIAEPKWLHREHRNITRSVTKPADTRKIKLICHKLELCGVSALPKILVVIS